METRLILDFFVQAFADADVAACCPLSLPNRECPHRPNAVIDPTPDEIRAATLEIQSTWTDRERDVRAGRLGALKHWRVPFVRVSGLVCDEE
jgi:hypothetical protein